MIQCSECLQVVQPVNDMCPKFRCMIVPATAAAGGAIPRPTTGGLVVATDYPELRRSGGVLQRYSVILRVLAIIAAVIAVIAFFVGLSADRPVNASLAFSIVGSALAWCGGLVISGAIFGVAGTGADALADLAANSARAAASREEIRRGL